MEEWISEIETITNRDIKIQTRAIMSHLSQILKILEDIQISLETNEKPESTVKD